MPAFPLLLAGQELARREHRTAGQVISQMAHKGMLQARSTLRTQFMGFEPIRSHGVIVTNKLIQKLLDEGLG